MKDVRALAFFAFFLIAAAIAVPAMLAVPARAQSPASADCTANETIPCGSNIGACQQGIRVCENGQWSDCMNEIGPVTEICTNSIDDDCDGIVDECGGFLWMVMIGLGLLLFGFGIAVANKWTD